MARAAAFFDLDKTVIAKSSTLAMGRPFYHGGLITRRAVLTSTYAQLVYLLGGADESQMDRMRAYLQELSRGWDAQQVKDVVAETLHDIVDPLVYDEAVTLIEEHHAAGRDVVIVSSSGQEIVEGIGEMVGADLAIGSRAVVVDGKYTGELEFYAYGEAKATAIRELADRAGYDLAECYAYSDSMTDLPMLDVVGHPYVVNPDKGLRTVAAERGWPVLRFTRPVSLRARIRALPRQRAVIAGAAVGAAALGWAWYSRTHRDRQWWRRPA
ncbi:MAG: HAD-IB family hydrolase [Frankia sp.]|nr:HAD-IB family hydrolase [Frankia sp.]